MEHDFSTIEGIRDVMREVVKQGKKLNLNVYIDINLHYGHFTVHAREYNETTQEWGNTVYGDNVRWLPLSTENLTREIIKITEWMSTYREDRVGRLESNIASLTESLKKAKDELKKLKKNGKNSNTAPGN